MAVPLETVLQGEENDGRGVGDVFASLSMGVGPVAPCPAPDMEGDVDAARFQRQTEQVIRKLAEGGGVILGRGAMVVLADDPGVLKVRLDGPPDRRVERVVDTLGISVETARRDQRHTDRARQVYLRHFYDVDPGDPALYDLIIDTTAVGPDAAARMIVEGVRGRVSSSLR